MIERAPPSATQRPALRYHGSKWKIAPWVIEHFPPHRVYVEPYGGAAAVLLRKPPAVTEVWNDLSADLVNFFRVLRDAKLREELFEQLLLTPYSRSDYAGMYAPRGDAVDRARVFVARSFMAANSKGADRLSGFDTRINADGYCSRLRSFRAAPHELAKMAERLGDVIVEHRPALDLIRLYDGDGVLFFLDPPYLRGTRAGDAVYRHEMRDADHLRLLDQARRLNGFVVIAGYPSDLYDRMLQGWGRVERQAFTDGARKRTEVLWLCPRTVAALARERQGSLFEGVAL